MQGIAPLRAIFIAYSLLGAQIASAAPAAFFPQYDFDHVRKFIAERMAKDGTASLAVAVAKDGRIVWEEGFGWADREHRIAATAHTPYITASLTKPVTATAVMILAEQGKLALDRPANDYLGVVKLKGLAADADLATIRRIANQSSGLPPHYQYFFSTEHENPPALDETIRRYGNVLFQPGERFIYSNLGYGILGDVISRVSGESYPKFLQDRIFTPLQMRDSSVWPRRDLTSQTAVPYRNNGERIPPYTFDTPASGAVFASAHDMILFANLHLGALQEGQRKLLSDGSIEEMQKPRIDADPAPLKYGLGWFINEDLFGYRCVFHSGSVPGGETLLRLIPSEHIAVVALSNNNGALPALAVHEILSILLPEYAARRKTAQDPVMPPAQPFHPDPSWVGEWRGTVATYERKIPVTLSVKENGDVHARLGSQLETVVNDIALHGNHFTGDMTGDIGTSDADREGRAPYNLHLDLARKGETLEGAMITEPVEGANKRAGSGLAQWVQISKVR